jgi:methyl-accepting chemotaxis protein
VAFGIVDYLRSADVVTESATEAQEALANELSREIGLFITERYADLEVLAQSVVFTDPQVREQTSFEQKVAQLDSFLKTHGYYDSIALFDLNGDALVKVGGAVGRNDQGQITNNIRDRDHFQAVLETDRPVISQPSISSSTGELSIFMVAPVKDAVTGETIAIMRTRMPAESFNQILDVEPSVEAPEEADSALGGTANETEYHLVAGDGKIFATNAPEQMGQEARAEMADFPQIQAARRTATTISADARENVQQLVSFASVSQPEGLPDLNWSVLVAEDTATAFAAQRTLVLALVLGVGLSAFLVSTFATYLADRATRPILLAADAVEKIGQGDLETRLELEGEDEVASLGDNINNMAAQLQELIAAQAFEASQERLLTAAKGSGVLDQSDLQAIFDQTLEGARLLLNLDRLVIYRFDTETGNGIVAESVAPDLPSALENNVNDACIPQTLRDAYRQGRVMANNDVAEADWHPDHIKLMNRLQVKANLVVPMLGGGQLFGLLIAHACNATHEWQESEITFLKRLGTELGLSVYRVELLEQTANLAEEQRQLKEALQKRALELLQEVDPISRGDLTTRAKVTADEIGTIADSYNATVDNLRRIVLQVQEAANQVVATTSVNETSIEALSIEALRQAEEIATALELVQGMASAVQTVAYNAEQAEQAVQQAAETVEEGDAVMNRTVEGIQGIRATVADTAKKVKHLGESSQKISKVVELISAFAAQTNMLALNASIEASRAGEEGKGFAVVANEVRTLARQSAEATEEIRSLISSIQAETNEVVAAMESGIEQVVTGTKLVDETRQSLNKITTVSAQISGLVEAIAQSATAQAQTSETVTQTMQDVAAIANKTSTEANQVSSSFEQLRQVAQTLQTGVGQFKV